MITALNNKSVKRVCLLQKSSKDRRQEGSFIIEGLRMFEETPEELIRSVFVTADFYEKYPDKARLDRLKAEMVSDQVFAKMSDTVSPQGVLAEVAFPKNELYTIITNPKAFLLCLQDIQDPGNLGTMLRTAEGAGITGIVLSRGCADIYSPKVIRSTMGAIYRMPFAYTEDLDKTVRDMQAGGIRVYAAALRKSIMYTDQDYRGKCAILIGNEGNGLTEKIVEASDSAICIPMDGKVESLNAAISAGIIMYEARRQRNIK